MFQGKEKVEVLVKTKQPKSHEQYEQANRRRAFANDDPYMVCCKDLIPLRCSVGRCMVSQGGVVYNLGHGALWARTISVPLYRVL